MNNDKHDILIEKFYRHTLDKEEQLKFDALLKEESFNLKVKSLKPVYQLIKAAGRSDLKKIIDNFDNKEDQNINTKTTSYRLAILFTFLFTISLIIFGIYTSLESKRPNHFAENFTPYDNPATFRDSNIENKSWKNAINFYSDKEYEKAISSFELSRNGQNNGQVNFYIANCYLAQQQPDYQSALNNINDVFKSENDYHHQALWLKSLILIKTGDKSNAIEILNQIEIAKRYKFKEAKSLLESLTK
jgi:hypothetical protein